MFSICKQQNWKSHYGHVTVHIERVVLPTDFSAAFVICVKSAQGYWYLWDYDHTHCPSQALHTHTHTHTQLWQCYVQQIGGQAVGQCSNSCLLNELLFAHYL
jgi:hypothetical protein